MRNSCIALRGCSAHCGGRSRHFAFTHFQTGLQSFDSEGSYRCFASQGCSAHGSPVSRVLLSPPDRDRPIFLGVFCTPRSAVDVSCVLLWLGGGVSVSIVIVVVLVVVVVVVVEVVVVVVVVAVVSKRKASTLMVTNVLQAQAYSF